MFFLNKKLNKCRVGPIFQARAGAITNFIFLCGLIMMCRLDYLYLSRFARLFCGKHNIMQRWLAEICLQICLNSYTVLNLLKLDLEKVHLG